MNIQLLKLTGINKRKFIVTGKDLSLFGVKIKKGFESDGESVPRLFILTLATALLLFVKLPDYLFNSLILFSFFTGISDNMGWFMKPAVVHDYKYINANSLFGWIPANFEYLSNMLSKVEELVVKNPNEFVFPRKIYHMVLGTIMAIVHFLGVMAFGWIIYYKYYFKNKG